MKFEKLDKDKIKVTLDNEDLSEKDIDFHSFMANSEETQKFFLELLKRAEKDLGFSTENYNLRVDTVALAGGNYILTITRVLNADKEVITDYPRTRVKANRKVPKLQNSSIVYKFNSFDDFCKLSLALSNNSVIDYKQISKDAILYNNNGFYYLILININIKYSNLKSLFSLITEFATYISSSDAFIARLHENGNIIFKKKAIQNCIKYFC